MPWYEAECFSLLDERQEAINWLEHAVDRAFINWPLFAELDSFLENIRGEHPLQEAHGKGQTEMGEF